MRIIAGKYKGRVLNTLNHEGTRPTPDRVREALFSKIQIDIKGGIVLDLFSGTGALSFEAISRGAKECYLVDKNEESYNLITANNKLLDGNAKIYNMDFKIALEGFKASGLKFDVIFLDPPYDSNLALEALDIVASKKLLKKEGALIFEHDKEKLGLKMPSGLKVYDRKRYGRVYLTFITLDE
jgi:16S rRNA (guanine(966)-N(2))-methyltransferase RsmD